MLVEVFSKLLIEQMFLLPDGNGCTKAWDAQQVVLLGSQRWCVLRRGCGGKAREDLVLV